MPNIYYSSPSVPFASATQGFLGNLKDFTKLNLQQQAIEQRGEIETESQKLRAREAELREQQLGLSALREARLAQGQQFDPVMAQGVVEMMHEGIMESMPGAQMIRVGLERGKIDPMDALQMVESYRDDRKWRTAKKNKREEVITEAKTLKKRLKDEFGYSGKDLRKLDEMLAEITSEEINQDIDPWEFEDAYVGEASVLMMARQQEQTAVEAGKTNPAKQRTLPPTADISGNTLVGPIPEGIYGPQAGPTGAEATVQALDSREVQQPYGWKSLEMLPEPEQIKIREGLLQSAVGAGSLDDLNKAVHKMVTETGIAPSPELLTEIYQAFQSRYWKRFEDVMNRQSRENYMETPHGVN